MHRWLSSLATCLVLAVAALAATPSGAQAQCTWGCTCMGNSCGCNMNGNGKRCDASGSGCVIVSCGQISQVFFAPDGSLVRLASAQDAEGTADPREETAGTEPGIGGTTRWEATADGGSVARHCSGVVVARYDAREQAIAIREASRTLAL